MRSGRQGVGTASGPGSPRGHPAWGGGSDRVSGDGKIEFARRLTRSLPIPVLTSSIKLNEKGESCDSRLRVECWIHPLTQVVLTISYAGAGVPPVIGGKIGLSGFADGSFAAGSSC